MGTALIPITVKDPVYSKEELLFQVVLYKIAFTAMLDETLVALSSWVDLMWTITSKDSEDYQVDGFNSRNYH